MRADDEAALLSEIRARPDDDGPRLVFADALSERGDPWGELIVAGCELARLAREGVVDARRRRELEERCREIQVQRWRERSFDFDAMVERGFCKLVDDFHGNVVQAEGYEFAVLRDVMIWVSASALGAFARWSLLGQVDRLVFRGLGGGGDDRSWRSLVGEPGACVRVLARIGHRARPSSVELHDVALDEDELTSLERSPLSASLQRLAVVRGPRTAARCSWPALKALELVGLELTGAEIGRVLRRPELDSLTALDVSNNSIGAVGLNAILDRALPTLRTLRIANTAQPPNALITLARSSLVRRLAALSIGEEHDLPARLLCALAEAAGQLVELVIDQPSLTADGSAEVVHRLRSPLRTLRLRGGERGLPLVTALLGNPALRGLRSLDLSGQPLGRDAMVALARAELPLLERLDLSSCGLDQDAADELAQSTTLPRRLAIRLHHNALKRYTIDGALQQRFHDVRY
jgi:uncharacterized protein (TIGR02996 family)